MIVLSEFDIACPFADLGAVHAALIAIDAARLDERFDADGAILRVRLPAEHAGALALRLRDATRDRARLSPVLAPA